MALGDKFDDEVMIIVRWRVYEKSIRVNPDAPDFADKLQEALAKMFEDLGKQIALGLRDGRRR